MRTVADDIAGAEAEKAKLEHKIKICKAAKGQLLEKARDIKNFSDSVEDLARLMVGMVNLTDNQEIYESSKKDVDKTIKKDSYEEAQKIFDFEYDVNDALEEAGYSDQPA